MNKVISKVLAILMILLLLTVCGLIFLEYVNSSELKLLVAFIIMSTIGIIVILSFVFDVIIGRKKYFFQNKDIIAGRNDRLLYKFSNAEILSPIVTYDSASRNKGVFSFIYNNKKHRIYIDEGNKRALDRFCFGLKAEICENYAQYLIESILEILCI